MQEEWRPVVGYEGLYDVSNIGRVKSFPRKYTCGKILKGDKTGRYLRYRLSKNSFTKTFSGHRLVSFAFIPNPENKPYVNHIDNDKLNNNLNNLEWCTAKENSHHEMINGRLRYGEKNNKAKLKEFEVLEIRKSKETLVKLGKKYKVHFSIISDIKNYKTWKHLP